MVETSFLVISGVSLIVHLTALSRIAGGASGAAARGLVRTATCRVVAALLYVALGVYTILRPVGVETLLVFGVVQLIWHGNALADVRLHRTLPRAGRGRHEK